jgi:hypothetical protein
MLKIKKYIFLIIFITILANCAQKDPVTGEKVLIEPNIDARSRQAARESGGLMGMIGKGNQDTNFRFSSSNVLWRASLKTLEFMPLLNADYSGGIIITDWYSDNINSDEQIKIQIRFLSNEVRSDSLEINVHKKKCDISNRCSQILLKNSFPQDIKDSILTKARQIKIEDEKSKKN